MDETAPRLIDLSHRIEEGMITYRGLPAPIICDFLSREDSRAHYAPDTEFAIHQINLVGNSGTYLDAPFHRFAAGRDIADLLLNEVADLPGVVIRVTVRAGQLIDHLAFAGGDLKGKAVLIHTGWDQHWRTDQYFEGHPCLTRSAAEHLVAAGVALVGIDSLNIDDTSDGTRPVHTLLLGADIPIVEHLCNLGELPHGDFRFSAVPVKVRGVGSFPVRAFASVPS